MSEDIFKMTERLLYEKQTLITAMKKIVEVCNTKDSSGPVCKRIAIKSIEEVTNTKFIPE